MTNHNEDAEIFAEGVLEVAPDGHGFLRSPDYNYRPAHDDVYVSPDYINGFNLKTGDTIGGRVRPPLAGEAYFTLAGVDAVNFESPDLSHARRHFYSLTKVDARERLRVETTRENLCGRVIDLMFPLGKGHSGLIVGPPHTGAKLLIENIVNGIATNHPNLTVSVLLIGAEPADASALKRALKTEVFFSTWKESEARHIQLAEIVLEKAKRLAEQGGDVVVLIDSISRLICAYYAVLPSSDDALAAGMDHPAVRHAQRFLSASRKFQERGSLTVIATAEAGTTAQDGIHDVEKWADILIRLDRRLLKDGIFPAVNIHRSRNGREELLLPEEDLGRIRGLRRVLSPLSPSEAVKLLCSKLLVTCSNAVFLSNMASL
jgi:transcription termination factor Rho